MRADGDGRSGGQFRFVHASDLNLDSPVRGVAGAPAALRTVLRDASLLAWRALVELAVARDAAFVLLAGGLFDPDGVTLRACTALREGVQRLRERSIDVLIALAPPEATVAASLPWLAAGAILFPPDRVTAVRVSRGGHCLAIVHGASRGTADAARLASTCRRLGSGLEIGMLPDAFEANAATDAPPAELSRGELDYWALGGARVPAVLQRRPWTVCAGTAQGRGFAPGEIGPKGGVVVDVDGGRIAAVAHAAVDSVRFLVVEVDVDGCSDLAAICRRLLHAAEQQRGGDPAPPAVIEAVLRGGMASAVRGDRLASEAELLAALRHESAQRAPHLWWARVRDRSVRAPRQPPAALAPLRRILTEQSEALNAPLPRSSFLARTFAPLLRQWGAETDLDGQRELVREAAELALHALAAESSR